MSLSEDDQEGSVATSEVTAAGTLVWGSASLTASGGNVHLRVPGQGSAVFKLR